MRSSALRYDRSRGDIDAALAAPETGSPRVVDLTLTLKMSPGLVEEFNQELPRIAGL